MATEITKAAAVPTKADVEEPEIVAVNPPPADPKRSQPPVIRTSPPVHHQPQFQQQYQSPPLSPLAHQLQATSISYYQQAENVPELLAELPDTSIDRPKSPLETPLEVSRKAPVNDVTVLVAEDVVLTPGGCNIDLSEFENLVGEKNLGSQIQEQYKLAKLKKLRDPAVMIEVRCACMPIKKNVEIIANQLHSCHRFQDHPLHRHTR
ncbi:hypothetical protein DFH27DRAFT_575140 [Peziza echinospora]|nr:hypothetical protein DFH27DRAFT_575140 [Peziza echinospora]